MSVGLQKGGTLVVLVMGVGGGYMRKWGRFLVLPVLCLLAYGDTALKAWFLLGVIVTLLELFLPTSEYFETPKYCKTREMQK